MRIHSALLVPAFVACTHGSDTSLVGANHSVCPPPGLFEHAVCACGDLDQVGELHVRPGPAGTGSVGVNGNVALVADADIAGSLYAWGGFESVGGSIGDRLVTPSDVVITGDATIHDATIGGDLVVTGDVTIDKLALGGNALVTGSGSIAPSSPYSAPSAPPCGCEGASLYDVAGAVAQARDAVGGQTSWDNVGDQDVHLVAGSYYVTSADIVGSTHYIIEGNVSVFVDGDLDNVGTAQWQLQPGATLDLLVSGNVNWVGDMTAGDPSNPGALRLYVGGTDGTSIDAVGTAELAASIYAPRADINYVGDAHVVGSIFAHSINGVGSLTIDYGTPQTIPQSCTQPPGGSGSGSGSGGIIE